MTEIAYKNSVHNLLKDVMKSLRVLQFSKIEGEEFDRMSVGCILDVPVIGQEQLMKCWLAHSDNKIEFCDMNQLQKQLVDKVEQSFLHAFIVEKKIVINGVEFEIDQERIQETIISVISKEAYGV